MRPGERAPEFRLALPFGQSLTLADLAGPTALLFVPGAFTPVCTQEVAAHAAADLGGARLLVVSCDSAAVLDAWRAALGLGDLAVASDFWPHGAVARSFGAFDEERGTARRRTVLLDEAGVVRFVADSPGGVARAAGELAQAAAGLSASSVT